MCLVFTEKVTEVHAEVPVTVDLYFKPLTLNLCGVFLATTSSLMVKNEG